MRTTSVRDARSQFSELIHGKEAVIVTSNGKPAAVVYPLSDPEKVPMEVRRELFREFSQKMARELKAHGLTEEDVLRDFAASKKRRRGR
jgi:prevent-host-death family protein